MQRSAFAAPLAAATLALGVLSLSISACSTGRGAGSAASSTPMSKTASSTRSDMALEADRRFWDAFHHARYEQIQPALDAMTGAYLRDPSDAVTASHVGWLHIWRISERSRNPAVTPTVTDDITLAREYFQEASTLNPSDARLLGFLASATLSEGAVHRNPAESALGADLMARAVQAWPEFNLFTAGYMASTKPAESPEFKQGLAWQWDNLDVCVGAKVDRADPDYAPYQKLATASGPKRACWNSEIAPHNVEGFFLNMGDMLVKSGDWRLARKVYSAAKTSPDYGSWPFAKALDERIRDAEANVAPFSANKGIMINSPMACMGCHQSS